MHDVRKLPSCQLSRFRFLGILLESDSKNLTSSQNGDPRRRRNTYLEFVLLSSAEGDRARTEKIRRWNIESCGSGTFVVFYSCASPPRHACGTWALSPMLTTFSTNRSM